VVPEVRVALFRVGVGQFRLDVRGLSRRTGVIEASGDLLNWNNVESILSGNEVLRYELPMTLGETTAHFYRVSLKQDRAYQGKGSILTLDRESASSKRRSMPHPMRIEFEDAMEPVMNRGDRGRPRPLLPPCRPRGRRWPRPRNYPGKAEESTSGVGGSAILRSD